jgi:predicted nuclease of predicted toxin-antitoxin system
MSLRFLIDAQLPPALVHRLASIGHQADHVHEIGLGLATDLEIWAYAGKKQAVLVTKDHDFVDLTLSEPGRVAVVWIRLGNTTNKALWHALEPALPEIVEAITRGETLIEIA